MFCRSLIAGEVHAINVNQLVDVDKLEGHPFMYKRTQIEITLERGDKVFIRKKTLLK